LSNLGMERHYLIVEIIVFILLIAHARGQSCLLFAKNC